MLLTIMIHSQALYHPAGNLVSGQSPPILQRTEGLKQDYLEAPSGKLANRDFGVTTRQSTDSGLPETDVDSG